MKESNIKPEDLVLVSEEMIGLVLIKCERDSYGTPISPYEYYKVEKHIPTGKLWISPAMVPPMDKQFVNSILNAGLKKSGKLN
jgi:hypothetical protein